MLSRGPQYWQRSPSWPFHGDHDFRPLGGRRRYDNSHSDNGSDHDLYHHGQSHHDNDDNHGTDNDHHNCGARVYILRGPASGRAVDRAGWVASTNAPETSADAPANALDANLTTRFSTNQDQASGLYLEVNLGSAQDFYELALAVPSSPTDYARGYDVDVSANGTSWATVAKCTGTTTPEMVSFDAQSAHYLKVVLTSAATKWWSVDELNLYGKVPAPTTTTTTKPSIALTAASLWSSANPASVGQAVTYTAKVLPGPSGGTVNFFDNGAPIKGCAKVALTASSGEATCAATYFSSGRHGMQAFFSGQGLFGPRVRPSMAKSSIFPPPVTGSPPATARSSVRVRRRRWGA